VSQTFHNGDTTSITIPQFADNEDLSGKIDGQTTAFQLLNTPNPNTSVHVHYNAGRQGPDQYSVSNNTLTLKFTPQLGDSLVVDYRF
jgi:hypothetical protein